MPLLDFNQYKYILFVDASGDDGYKFGKTSSEASSYSFVVSSFVTTPGELEYNKNILLKMKESINVKPEQELKSTSIKKAILSTVSYDKYDLLFRDSKDKDFPLIQIADIIAGTVRSYYEDTLPIKTHNRFCYACSMSMLGKGPRNILGKCMEKRYKKLYLPYVTNKNFNITISLHKDTPSATTNDGHFIILPVNQIFYYEYIDCHILQNRPWQTKK